jgi:hypothetical protein
MDKFRCAARVRYPTRRAEAAPVGATLSGAARRLVGCLTGSAGRAMLADYIPVDAATGKPVSASRDYMVMHGASSRRGYREFWYREFCAGAIGPGSR